MIERILCAVDFSEISKNVALYSGYLAEKLNSELFVLHVVKSLVWAEEFGTTVDFKESYEDDLYQMACTKMDKFVKMYFSKEIKLFSEIRKGDIVREIIRFTQEKKIDLIVIGAHGEHGIHEFIFGSVTEKVVKLSKVPVFVVRG